MSRLFMAFVAALLISACDNPPPGPWAQSAARDWAVSMGAGNEPAPVHCLYYAYRADCSVRIADRIYRLTCWGRDKQTYCELPPQ